MDEPPAHTCEGYKTPTLPTHEPLMMPGDKTPEDINAWFRERTRRALLGPARQALPFYSSAAECDAAERIWLAGRGKEVDTEERTEVHDLAYFRKMLKEKKMRERAEKEQADTATSSKRPRTGDFSIGDGFQAMGQGDADAPAPGLQATSVSGDCFGLVDGRGPTRPGAILGAVLRMGKDGRIS